MIFAAFALAGALVNPFIGTGGTTGDGLIDDFPGASAPFGMLQWSPDTRSMPPSGGYFYRDTEIEGFSLTHLSGAGCSVFGDFRVFPTPDGAIAAGDAHATFSHADETASPGYYAVALGNGTYVRLAATRRVGLGTFAYPGSRGSLIVDAGSDQAGVTGASVRITGPNEVEGFATGGGFCGMPNAFTVYVAMRFDHPIVADGEWDKGLGARLTFDTSQQHVVTAKAAISYVSAAAARANLNAEPAQTVDAARTATANAWNRLLGEIRIDGGSGAEQTMFATAIYHALLSPTLFSDADGRYRGFDDKIHTVRAGHDEYANFSGWDIYRTQVPLMAMLSPRETSDMMQSMVDAAKQGGWLPKWPVANGYTGVMGGDSAAPIVAEAYAFGARDFDASGALQAMVKNATSVNVAPGQGWYRPRPGLEEYLARGYVVNAHTTDVSPVPNGASTTLEYAVDDFAISRFAKALGQEETYRTFARRAMNWTNLFDGDEIAPRDAEGAFVWQPPTSSGQSGFQEGNSAQYTWMVPQSPATLVQAMGGKAIVSARLDRFLSILNAGQSEAYAWLGNEPSLGTPWMYLYTNAPYRAQAVNRAAMLTLYGANPDGIPGNDDLGTMSAWWAWNAMGLYPFTPGTQVLLIGTPLFKHVAIASPSGYVIDIDAPNADDAHLYAQALRFNGRATDRLWMTIPERGRTRLAIDASVTPNRMRGTAYGDAPPSYAYGKIEFPATTRAWIRFPQTTTDARAGTRIAMQFDVANGEMAKPATVAWEAVAPPGLSLSPTRGSVSVADVPDSIALSLIVPRSVRPGLYDVVVRAQAANGARLPRSTAVVRVASPSGALKLAYVANFSDDTVTPVDLTTRAFGEPIAVGRRPGAIAISRDGSRIYTADQGSNDVTVLDATTGTKLATIKTGNVPADIRLTPDGTTLWLTDYGDGTLQSIDVATDKAAAPIPVGSRPEELAIAPDGSRIYVVDQGDNDLAVVDAKTKCVIAHVPVGRGPQAIVTSTDGSRIYVTNAASDDISIIDTRSLATIARISVGKNPQGLAISPNGKVLYVADASSGEITPIDLERNRAEPPIQIGNGPFAVVFAPDGKTTYVTNTGDNDIAVVDVAARRVTTTIATGNFPIAIER